jgi:hypothetical protein
MKSLSKKQGIAYIVSQLSGYLQAVRDLNDDQSGDRYWYWADMLYIKGRKIDQVIRAYLKTQEVELRSINLREELAIIEKYVSANYLQGTSDPKNQRESYIRNLHGWRIQEYISMAANYEKEDGRWFTESKNEKETRTTIFVKIRQRLVVMDFLKVDAG